MQIVWHGPVGVVERRTIAGIGHDEHHLARTGQIDPDTSGHGSTPDHAAVEAEHTVGPDLEGDAATAQDLVVHADARDERAAGAVERVAHVRVGMHEGPWRILFPRGGAFRHRRPSSPLLRSRCTASRWSCRSMANRSIGGRAWATRPDVGPVGMVEGKAIACIGDDERNFNRAGQAHQHRLGGGVAPVMTPLVWRATPSTSTWNTTLPREPTSSSMPMIASSVLHCPLNSIRTSE